MKELKTSKGVIKYKNPNPIEAMRLLGKVKRVVEFEASSEEWIADVVDNMEFLFDMSEADCTYEDLKNEEESAVFLIGIAGDFIEKMTALYKKKVPSEMDSMPTSGT